MKKRDIYDVACEIANKIIQIKVSRMSYNQLHSYFCSDDGIESNATRERDEIYRFILRHIK